jgi:dienelactone hydrolase
MPGRYRVDRLWYETPRPSGVAENDCYPVEYFIPKRKATAAIIVLPMWKGGSLIAERTVAGNLAARGYLAAILPLPYQFQRAPKGVRSGSWTVSGDFERTQSVMRQALAEIEELTTRLAARPDVKDGRVGVVGISLGAHIAATAYQTDPRLSAGVFVMAGGDLASLLYRDVPETRRMRAEIKAQGLTREEVEEKLQLLDPARAERYPAWPCFPRYRGALMINAKEDVIVPPENARALHAALGEPTIHWFSGGHYEMALHLPEVLGIVHRHLNGLFR